MGLFRKIKNRMREDWCSKCQDEMNLAGKQLYALPTMMVGHYIAHEDAAYYRNNLVPIRKKAEIPTGMYACGIHHYRCPLCGDHVYRLTVFLPVRDEEKLEQKLCYGYEEMGAFFEDTYMV